VVTKHVINYPDVHFIHFL